MLLKIVCHLGILPVGVRGCGLRRSSAPVFLERNLRRWILWAAQRKYHVIELLLSSVFTLFVAVVEQLAGDQLETPKCFFA